MLVDEILRRVAAAGESKAPLAHFLKIWLPQTAPLSPWAVWTLLSLVRHRERQQFVADAVRSRLHGDLEAIADMGALGHPPGEQRGLLPDLTQWEFYFHGCGCCLTHRVTGESIDVDFHDDTADWFDDYFYVHYLRSLRTPEFWEQRVLALHPTFDTVIYAFDELQDAGLLEQHPESKAVRLSFDSELLLERMEQVEQSCDTVEGRVRLAASIGDWPYAGEFFDGEELQSVVLDKSTQILADRMQRLSELFDRGIRQHLALKALAEFKSPQLPEYLKRALAGPPCGTTSAALDIISQADDGQWCVPICALMNRIDPDGEAPQPHLWLCCLEYLLRHQHQTERTLRQLPRAGSYTISEAAVLALEHSPGDAQLLFRRALRSEIPVNRIVAAAVLAIIDQPWSRRELIQVLEESDEQIPTAECRAALLETHSQEAQQVVRDWEARNPHEAEYGEFISMEEMTLRSSGDRIRWEMQTWHDRVWPLRSIAPPEPKSHRWPF